VTNIVYVIWASAEVQPFNEPHLLKKSRGSISSNSEEEMQHENPAKAIDGLKRDSLKDQF
jgi:hypothetical protein